jgi:cytochrome c biogenesis protein CcdA/thiol-disulfide isomerase/thioredoxin
MIGLILVGAVAGFLAGISPCILPVLPVVLVAGVTQRDSAPAGAAEPDRVLIPAAAATPPAAPPPGAAPAAAARAGAVPDSARPRRAGLGRPLAVIGGLVVSFSLLILAGSEIISLLHLPQNSLRDAGIVLLAVVGLGYLIRPLGALLERPFARVGTWRVGTQRVGTQRVGTQRVGTQRPNGASGGFVLGLALGVLYVPCAGPVLAAITVVGATRKVGLTAVFVTAAFAIGTAVPLLAVAVAGGQLSRRVSALRRHAPAVRQAGGAVLIVMAVAIALNAFQGLERDVPSYSSALQGSARVRAELNGLTGTKTTALTKCPATATTLVNCGPAPNFTKITAWLNTPGGKPLTIAGLRGKVVLVDFWTYSCINCQRSLPHVEAWYRDYAKDGLVVVGVHTPEFAFEHVVSNVRSQAAALGVHYPVAIDDSYGTWDAYDNEYWPAEYLIDAQGDVRHVSFGEGDYTTTETLIRQLLQEASPGVRLPAATDVPNLTPTGELSPETYVGYQRLQYLDPIGAVADNVTAKYRFPATLPPGYMGLSGAWTIHAEEATAGAGARLELSFLAKDIYLVMGGSGTVSVSINGHHTQTVAVSGIPRLYTLYQAGGANLGRLQLQLSPGVQAYDFTFG